MMILQPLQRRARMRFYKTWSLIWELMPFLTLCVWFLFFSWVAHAGGVYVGNAPVFASFTTPSTPMPFNENADDGANTPRNSLLLGNDDKRLTIGFGRVPGNDFSPAESEDRHSRELGILGFDMALSEDWSLFNLTTLGYNIKAGNGVGHEMALYFGLVGGWALSLYYDTKGVFLLPGVAFTHTWGGEAWRFTNSATLITTAYLIRNSSKKWDAGHVDQYFLMWRTHASRKLGDSWNVGVSVVPLYAFAYFMGVGGLGVGVLGFDFVPLPSLEVGYQINDSSTVNFILGSPNNVGSDSKMYGAYVSMTTLL